MGFPILASHGVELWDLAQKPSQSSTKHWTATTGSHISRWSSRAVCACLPRLATMAQLDLNGFHFQNRTVSSKLITTLVRLIGTHESTSIAAPSFFRGSTDRLFNCHTCQSQIPTWGPFAKSSPILASRFISMPHPPSPVLFRNRCLSRKTKPHLTLEQ